MHGVPRPRLSAESKSTKIVFHAPLNRLRDLDEVARCSGMTRSQVLRAFIERGVRSSNALIES